VSGPALVAHADWSVDAKKRWMAVAVQQEDLWHAAAPEPVGEPSNLLPRLHDRASGGGVLAGFDFPIGLPAAYARRTRIEDFPGFLKRLGAESAFWRVCRTADEIDLARPFYPDRPGGTSQEHLMSHLNLRPIDQLRRRCELPSHGRRAACPLFWTLGGNQVGKAAISGWRDFIAPALADKAHEMSLWPFDGELTGLLRPGRAVIAETYPAEFYRHLEIAFGGKDNGKRNQAARRRNAEPLLAGAKAAGLVLEPETESQLRDGFGPRKSGEDPFDAMVGLVGMLNVLAGRCPLWEPTDPVLRRVEGWIFGQAAPPP